MCSSTIPSLFYEAKRKLRDLGLGYETIHMCKYGCVLYWKEFADLQHCPRCGEASDKRVETDDVLRHPADAEGWKHFDSEFPDFASDPRNVHLGLASDGFNPFGQMSSGRLSQTFQKVQRPEGDSCQPTKRIGWMSNHGRTRLLDRSSLTIIVAGSKSFLQRQYELAERKWELVDRVELFRKTHVRAGTFVSQTAEDAHNQMLELQSQPTLESSQPLSEDEICDQVLGRRLGYSKGLGWGPKPKARRTVSASISSTSCLQSTEKEIELQVKLHEALERIEVQDRNHQALASQVESMKNAQQGPPHDS
ncbi:CACTA en-spm transposon protein [Cucumis melo var. makuwa]|uniref:CACTA en-spm transposon protein n=1 Tax=Cucumis melo var. makuwa TaxID=1194695 RepID=A0A5D3BU08_CUCMM|nr:CACTA en-spm transposon protein [Cucumis melo var. makuwa]TYK02664.1 CACTA en-spm transposon protein [Cucumis melo var. makuwa]